MLSREKHEEGGYYCFCDGYRQCCCYALIKPCFRQRRRRFYTMCKMQENSLRRECLELFDDEYVWTHRDWNTFETSRLSLREIIDYEKELLRLNGPELYFTFTYGQR